MDHIQEINPITISQAIPMVKLAIKANLVPFISGSPAIGKSSIVHQIAKAHNLKVIDMRLSQCDPTDLLGFPKVENGKAFYVPMATFPLETDPLPLKTPAYSAGETLPNGTVATTHIDEVHYDGWMLFLDEFNSAPRSVQAAAYKLVLDRMVGSHGLHKRCAIVCAGNKDTDGAIVEEMSTALQSRLIHMSLIVDPDEWNDWAVGAGMDHRITSYVQWQPTELYNFKPDHDDKTYASPRTWEFANRLLKEGLSERDPMFIPMMAGTIGFGAASQFRMFCEISGKLPTYSQVIANADKIEVPEEPSILFALSGAMASKFNKADIVPFLTFVDRMPAEFGIVTLKQTIKTDRSALALPEMQVWCAKNGKKLF